ncbi:MAG: hypothetical protein QM493_05765 [Sulfurovum sp.]
MQNIKTVLTTKGEEVSYFDEIIGSGTMKNVYFTTDNKRVVAFYREPLDSVGVDRIETIVNSYYNSIFNNEYGEYWKNLLCWPTSVVKDGDRYGIVMPKYRDSFKFKYGSINNDFLEIRGEEKKGKWFTTPTNRLTRLDPKEIGDWRIYLKISLNIARALRRVHATGLAHSDLSYNNVLISPSTGEACIVDLDGLVVPNKFPPDVIGTADFIAPEVVASSHLKRDDPQRVLPSRDTDRHALAVLIYQYLLLRHPLRGVKIHDINDPNMDETLAMGENALFIEHPTDQSNRSSIKNLKEIEKFWNNTLKLPYTITGPYLSKLFELAFVDGLHTPSKRPTADDWEMALIKTMDLLQPCYNDKCVGKYYPFTASTKPICPFCDTPHKGELPILNLYTDRGNGKFISDNHRIVVSKELSIYSWHIDRTITPNERLPKEMNSRVGYTIYHQNSWILVNEKIEDLADYTDSKNIKPVPIGGHIKLIEGLKLIVNNGTSRRLLLVQVVG